MWQILKRESSRVKKLENVAIRNRFFHEVLEGIEDFFGGVENK
jgi:hypothetical protein